MEPGPYGWEDEIYEIPYTLYRFYGDKGILRQTYPEMLKLIDKRQEFPGMILPEDPCAPYCDWLSPTGISPSKQFFSGCYYIHMLDRVGEIARILGDTATAEDLQSKAQTAKVEFNRRHLCPDGKDYDAHNQCGIVLPIAFGIAPEEYREALVNTLVGYIKETNYHVTTGFIGTRFLPEVLADYGYGDVVYKLLIQPTAPSWMDMLKGGASAISESWYGLADPDGGVSMAHFSLGAITGWFFEYLGGIRINDSTPGLCHIVLKPHPIREIGRFEAHYLTPMGEVFTHWHFEGDTPIFTYRIPAGMTAAVM
jgi:alpha-L-rhamnosidase